MIVESFLKGIEFGSIIWYTETELKIEFTDRFLGLYTMVLRHGGDLSDTHHQVARNSLRYHYCAH